LFAHRPNHLLSMCRCIEVPGLSWIKLEHVQIGLVAGIAPPLILVRTILFRML
jgi:hypothetical protein